MVPQVGRRGYLKFPHGFCHIITQKFLISYANGRLKLDEFGERLSSIETKLHALNNLPLEKSFLTQAAQSDDSQTDKENTLAMMWKYMTIHRRVQATEEAVEKVMNILNNVMGDLEQLKTVKLHLDELQQEQSKMAKRGENGGSGANLEKVGTWFYIRLPHSYTTHRLSIAFHLSYMVYLLHCHQSMKSIILCETKKLHTIFYEYLTLCKLTVYFYKFDSSDVVALKKDLAPFVTWSALEQALNNRETENKEAQRVAADRPDTAPLPSSPRDFIVNQEPPKTAMNPKEFTKVSQ